MGFSRTGCTGTDSGEPGRRSRRAVTAAARGERRAGAPRQARLGLRLAGPRGAGNDGFVFYGREPRVGSVLVRVPHRRLDAVVRCEMWPRAAGIRRRRREDVLAVAHTVVDDLPNEVAL